MLSASTAGPSHDELAELRAENARLRDALEVAERERAALHQFLDTPAVAMTQLLREGTIVLINEAGARNLGGTPSQFEGKCLYEIYPPVAEQTRQRIETTLDTGETLRVETTLKLPAGERCFRSTYYPVFDENKKAVAVHVVSQDVTDLKRTEQMLETTEGRLATILEYAPQLVIVLDADGVIRYTNRAPEGYDAAKVVGNPVVTYFPAEYVEPVHQGLRHVLDTQRPQLVEVDDIHGRRWEVRLAPILRHGQPHQVLAFAVDITDRRKAEERQRQLEAQVQRSHKLESLGVLAGGIAHDFNNLLVGVLGNAQLALRDVSAAGARDYLLDIVHAAQRAAELCRHMLAYAGRGKLTVEAVDLSKISLEMLDLVRASVSKRARLLLEFPDGLPLVEGDATQLGQVVMNLLTNASDALGGKDGVIALRSGVVQYDESDLGRSVLHEEIAPGSYVYVEVQDTGCGMDAETRSRMFDPFFTSKQLGTGLGLSAVLGIVRRHRGAIFVDSEPERGTTIRIALPAAQGLEPHTARLAPASEATKGTILVVDDEPMVRTVARRMLEAAGHRVLLAADGIEALVLYDAAPGDIDAVLLDLSMPRMDGHETLRELRSRTPRLPVVLASGFSAGTEEKAWADDTTTRFIAKPYEVTALLEAVHHALATARSQSMPGTDAESPR